MGHHMARGSRPAESFFRNVDLDLSGQGGDCPVTGVNSSYDSWEPPSRSPPHLASIAAYVLCCFSMI